MDRLIREIRDHVFAGRVQGTLAGSSWTKPGGQERPAQTADRAALLQEHMARTARALQASAADYAALLERRVGLGRQPGRMDYPAEIKRWRAFADQAGQMAERWEQSPLPRSHRRPASSPGRLPGLGRTSPEFVTGSPACISWPSGNLRYMAQRNDWGPVDHRTGRMEGENAMYTRASDNLL